MSLVVAGGVWAESWRPAALWVAMSNTTATRHSRRDVIGQFARSARAPLLEVAQCDLITYKMALVDAGRAPATIRHRIAVLRSLFRWLIEAGHHPGPNPASGIPVPKGRRVARARSLTGEQMIELLAVATNARDRAMVGLMADAGLRASEIVSLDVADVLTDAGRWVARIRNSKGGGARKVALTARARDLIVVHRGEGARSTIPGFPLFHDLAGAGRRLTVRTVYRIVADLAGLAGLGDLSPHDLRRTFATRALNAGAPGPMVQRAMGHQSLTTTIGYYEPGHGAGGTVADFLEGGS